jgi:glucan phosphoethanolaminetransferase (alkaline phosphatase superfamily)
MTTPLYPWPNNLTDLGQLFNYTSANLCTDISNPATCGSWLMFDFFLGVLLIILFAVFKQRHSFKESYAGASLIVAFLSAIIFAMPDYNFLRSLDLLFFLANAFISIMILYLAKD